MAVMSEKTNPPLVVKDMFLLKEIVSRDFDLLFFFHQNTPPGPLFHSQSCLKFEFEFADILNSNLSLYNGPQYRITFL
jgi:hypothetical protein